MVSVVIVTVFLVSGASFDGWVGVEPASSPRDDVGVSPETRFDDGAWLGGDPLPDVNAGDETVEVALTLGVETSCEAGTDALLVACRGAKAVADTGPNVKVTELELTIGKLVSDAENEPPPDDETPGFDRGTDELPAPLG